MLYHPSPCYLVLVAPQHVSGGDWSCCLLSWVVPQQTARQPAAGSNVPVKLIPTGNMHPAAAAGENLFRFSTYCCLLRCPFLLHSCKEWHEQGLDMQPGASLQPSISRKPDNASKQLTEHNAVNINSAAVVISER